ncbi:MAG: hypothetical protein ACPGVO_01055 [Spirulinaceae cyanobacterium]
MDEKGQKPSDIKVTLNEPAQTATGNVQGDQHNHFYLGNNPQSPNSLKEAPPQSKQRICLTLSGTYAETDRAKLEGIVALLQKLSGDTSIVMLDVKEGSIKLTIEGSEEGIQRLIALHKSDQLSELDGLDVLEIFTLDSDTDEQEKVRYVDKSDDEEEPFWGKVIRIVTIVSIVSMITFGFLLQSISEAVIELTKIGFAIRLIPFFSSRRDNSEINKVDRD